MTIDRGPIAARALKLYQPGTHERLDPALVEPFQTVEDESGAQAMFVGLTPCGYVWAIWADPASPKTLNRAKYLLRLLNKRRAEVAVTESRREAARPGRVSIDAGAAVLPSEPVQQVGRDIAAPAVVPAEKDVAQPGQDHAQDGLHCHEDLEGGGEC